MTKDDIKLLMADKKKETLNDTKESTAKQNIESDKKQMISENIKEYYLDTNINSDTPFYPYIYASAELRFYNQKRSIDTAEDLEYKLSLDISKTTLDWEDSIEDMNKGFVTKVYNNAQYAKLPDMILESHSLKKFEKELSNYLYANKKIELYSCKALKIESKLKQTKQEFIVEVEDTLKELREEKQEKLEDRFEVKLNRLEDKLKRLEIKLQKEEHDVSSKTTDTIMDIGLAVIGAFFGRKAISATNMRRGASAFKKGKGVLKERDDVKNVESLIEDVQNDMQELNLELQDEIIKIEDSLNIDNYEIEPLYIKPRRSDITVKDIALLWEK